MKKKMLARRTAALVALAGLGLAAPAFAQEKTVKIGVLNDMSSLYADIGGPNSVVAIKMAVEDSGLLKKGWKIDVVSGDHQNKPDVGVNIARQWLDSDKVDAIADTHAQLSTSADEELDALRKCLRTLQSDERRLLEQCYTASARVKDVAAAVGSPAGTVYKALSRIRQRLLLCIERRLAVEGAS